MKGKSLSVLAIAFATFFVSATLVFQFTQPALSQQPSTNVCPVENVHHWEKVDFIVTTEESSSKIGHEPNTTLSVIFRTSPDTAEDVKEKVYDYFGVEPNEEDAQAMFILGVQYGLICAEN